ncbi:aconitase family protein [Leisingera daeponensis]|uniref:LeuD/DmdB family oxidoreductase small subunit n=1 Tax=Leisingera daeponensis TaxID=405746 RepID=UPI0004150775|nr:aconitase family protein [Leisingera daeponensis]
MPSTLTQKIVASKSARWTSARAGDFLNLNIDWFLSSELSLNGMSVTYDLLSHLPIQRPDRFLLAIDHTVDPVSLIRDQKTMELVRGAQSFARSRGIEAFYDANEAIMHTAFYRNHGLPGQLVIGADSHTTSHGALGALAFGLGGADVAVASLTGSTWLQMPETIAIAFKGTPAFGVTGKDIILRTLKVLGSNTRALERVVEFSTEHPRTVSVDARFTICNMTAELGGLAGIFEPDASVAEFLSSRGRALDEAVFFKADAGAEYADHETIDLTNLSPQVAKPFSPDRVSNVDACVGQPLDGCFIGACTTTEEEIILGALVLKAMRARGVAPATTGKRLVVPGDVEMRRRLEYLGLLEVYRHYGFRIGVPGCHLCLGVGSEQAGEGETWLSSQNRNFRNRMGKGSLAWLASAATVAASAASMRIEDPRPYLQHLEQDRFYSLINRGTAGATAPVRYTEVGGGRISNIQSRTPRAVPSERLAGRVIGRAMVFGDNVDTDAIIPGQFCNIVDKVASGKKCFAFTRPEVPEACAAGQDIVVAGHGWGCGSSRENAAWALAGAGFKAVIARSFGFIHRRNLVNEGVPTVLLDDARFFDALNEDDTLEIDLETGRVDNLTAGTRHQGSLPAGLAADILAAGGLVPYTRSARPTPAQPGARPNADAVVGQ